MSTDWTDNRKNLMLFSGRAHPELAEQVAKQLPAGTTAATATAAAVQLEPMIRALLGK